VIDVSIVIVSYNARADLARCLDSLHASPPAAGHEIIVVDNQSSDGSVEAAATWPDVRVIQTGANLGFARATNIGIRASSGANLLLLNSDTSVPAGAIDGLLAELHRDPAVAVVGPRLVDATGRAELSYGRMLGPFNELRQKIRMRRPAVVEQLTRRRLPARTPRGCRGRRPARRTVLHVYGGRRLLRGDQGTRTADSLYARGGGHPFARALGRRGTGRDRSRLSSESDCFLREASPGVGALLKVVFETSRAGVTALAQLFRAA
jgi:glycosyltransferase involved in cell wall biosynthesis